MGPLRRIAQFKTIETNLFTPAAAPIGAIQQLRFPVTRVAYTPAVVTSRLFMLPGATYQDPELSWRYAVPPSGLGFVNGNGLGAGYNGTLWSGMAQADDVTAGSTGTFAGGALMVMRLTGDRQHLDLSADPRLADRVVDNGSTYPRVRNGNTAGKVDGRESERCSWPGWNWVRRLSLPVSTDSLPKKSGRPARARLNFALWPSAISRR
jgi:hypothetical protein